MDQREDTAEFLSLLFGWSNFAFLFFHLLFMMMNPSKLHYTSWFSAKLPHLENHPIKLQGTIQVIRHLQTLPCSGRVQVSFLGTPLGWHAAEQWHIRPRGTWTLHAYLLPLEVVPKQNCKQSKTLGREKTTYSSRGTAEKTYQVIVSFFIQKRKQYRKPCTSKKAK